MCHKDFENVPKERTKTVGGQEIKHIFLECPDCGRIYTICFESPSTKVLKKQIRKCTESLGEIRDEQKYKEKLKQIKKKKRRLQREMDIVRSKYENFFI